MAITEQKKIGGIPVGTVAEQATWLDLIIFGNPGVGKTYLAGSASEVEAMSPVLFLDVEGGTMSIRDVYPDIEVIRLKDIPEKRISAWDQITKVYEELRKGTNYKTIVIDSLTEVQKASMYWTMQEARKNNPDLDPDVARMRDWGKSIELMRKFIRAFRDLECNTIFTALESQVKDDEKIIAHTASLPGKLAFEASGFVDIVGCLYTKTDTKGETDRYLLSQPVRKYVAKDRSGNLPVTLENPSMTKLYSLVIGEEAS